MNEDCGILYEIPISTTELCITTENVMNVPVQSMPSLKIALGKFKYLYLCHYLNSKFSQ